MGNKEIVWKAVLSAVFGSMITATFNPLVALFFNELTFQSISVDNVLAIIGVGSIIGLSITVYSIILKWKDRNKEKKNPITANDNLNRDKVSLDIFWLKDESLEDSENLPPPEVIAAEIVENLQSALVQFSEIEETLKTK